MRCCRFVHCAASSSGHDTWDCSLRACRWLLLYLAEDEHRSRLPGCAVFVLEDAGLSAVRLGSLIKAVCEIHIRVIAFNAIHISAVSPRRIRAPSVPGAGVRAHADICPGHIVTTSRPAAMPDRNLLPDCCSSGCSLWPDRFFRSLHPTPCNSALSWDKYGLPGSSRDVAD